MPGAGVGAGTNVGGAQAVGGQDANRKSRKRRAAGDDGVGGDDDAKSVGGRNEYECRFCLMKFEKSQALGGHMNRHRQEREKEQVQQAHQILSSVVQQQLPRTWSSLSAEIIESPSGPGGSGGNLLAGATRQQFVAPPIATSRTQLPPSPGTPGSNCNFYLPSNTSSCNAPGNSNNMHNQCNQLQQWIERMDGYSNAASNSQRSVSFRQYPVENNLAISLQAAAVGMPSEFWGGMLRNSGTDGSPPLQVSPGMSTSSQAPGTHDIIYNSSELVNAFYNGNSI